MIDKDGKERREEIFKECRTLFNELKIMSNEISQIRNDLWKKQSEHQEMSNRYNQLESLIKSMIIHDCCPVEAKLKYRDEFAPSQNAGSEQMDVNTTSPGKTVTPLRGKPW